MFFVLSKVLYLFIVPATWVTILFTWTLLTKSAKRKKRLTIITIIVTLTFSNNTIYNKLVMAWQPTPVNISGKHYSVGILLGGMYGFDNEGRGYFNGSADRFIQACKLYHSGFIDKVLITGGSGSLLQNENKESDSVKAELIAAGVAEKNIIVEPLSRNTYENAIFSKRILDSLQIQSPYLLITSALHMPRSIKVFNKAKMKVDIYPCDYRSINRKFSINEDIIPNFKLLNDWGYFIKEIVGTWAYAITGKA